MRLFRKREDQNEKLIKNMEEYAKKEKIKQQESKVLGQSQLNEKPIKEKKLMCEVKGVKVYGIWYK